MLDTQAVENARTQAVALSRIRRAELVRAFIVSEDYCKVFGQGE